MDFPSNIMLVAAMNPTPNGNYFENSTTSQSFYKVQQYLSKLSQPLLDRIDFQIEVESVSIDKLTSVGGSEEKSETIKERVQRVRAIQFRRQGKNNALLNTKEILSYCELSVETLEFLRNAAKTLKFSARSFKRIKKISRRIADLDCSANIKTQHVAEAIQYRSLERLKQFLN